MKYVVDLEGVARYRPGEHIETVMRRYGLERVVKLASNEFPLPPFPEVIDAMQRVLPDINRYPDSLSTELRDALAARYRLPATQVVVGNGSLELLLILGEALLKPGAEAVFAAQTFALYQKMCDAHGARALRIPLRDHVHDLDAMAAAVTSDTSMVIVCNPNNPTGTYLKAEHVAAFVDRVPEDVLVVVDEAYNEFVSSADSQDTVALVRERSNVCLTRTFSKIYGLCALRVGYALAGEGVCAAIDTLRQPFNVGLLAQVAATEALGHDDELRRRQALTAELRARLVDGLRRLGVETLPSEANFVLTRLESLSPPGTGVCEALLRRGVIVRDGAAFGLDGWVRVSVGTSEEIDYFLESLAALSAGAPDGRGG
jgi:histidinol-phosphate aminotransferase